jgi:hypothetical protein
VIDVVASIGEGGSLSCSKTAGATCSIPIPIRARASGAARASGTARTARTSGSRTSGSARETAEGHAEAGSCSHGAHASTYVTAGAEGPAWAEGAGACTEAAAHGACTEAAACTRIELAQTPERNLCHEHIFLLMPSSRE